MAFKPVIATALPSLNLGEVVERNGIVEFQADVLSEIVVFDPQSQRYFILHKARIEPSENGLFKLCADLANTSQVTDLGK